MFHHLPIELLDGICQLVQPTDLVALARTSSAIYPVAQRLLYRHLAISPASHNLGVVVTLARKPELAQHVRTFALRLDCLTGFTSFYRLLAVALSNMTGLTSLDLFVDPSTSWVLQNTHRSTYPRLLHFGCSFPLDSHVAHFLNKTQALLELELDEISESDSLHMPSLDIESLPQLSQFVGSSHTAKAIVPGRPVQSIQLHSGDLSETDVVTLAESTADVVILGATTSSLPVPLLESLALRMPHLVYLRVTTTYNFSEAPDVTFYEHIGATLASLSDLEGFELSGMHWGSSPKAINDEARVWQQPLVSDIVAPEDAALDSEFYSELFLAY
ncbi:hypothetical protein Hypma_009579 [Hypsizygus marmoreus]|uniref:F-box domain-containing protein n=1 Tax=Hypsizygus marmoreus TaxID=39966 RepID=A0A369JVC3_HYPMA|nr:hypothetical protein Hypma_009579 [Hypsizygus marmoreus]